MMAAAITRALKLETVRRTADGGVWVADTSGPGRTKVAHSRQRYRMGVSVSWMRSLLHSLHVPSACSFRTGDICCRAFPKYSAACARLLSCPLERRPLLRPFRRCDPWEKHLSFMAKELFGTDGMRGIPGTAPLDNATLHATGRSLGGYLKREHSSARVLIGMDTRESGPHIASVLAAGLTQAGATVAFAGVITTPGVACLVRQNDFQAGVVISASHNPFQDNGVKLFSHAGMKFPDAVEEGLEADILKHRSDAPPNSPLRLTADESLDAEYLEFLRKKLIPGANLHGFRIVLDCANGAAFKLGPELFRSLGADVVAMSVSPDGRNINADCGSLHLEGLQKRVVQKKARLGVAFDGDADRALFVCETGKVVNGDGVLLAAARFLKSQRKLKGNRVVATSMSNLGLERILAQEEISLARAAVGDRYVLEEMLRSGNVLGGEQSGHIIFLYDSP